ncbi:MAG TPA: hypothetical protein VGH90_12455 [Chthoniobacteraceae bacterium]|jgi:hypothetical protein
MNYVSIPMLCAHARKHRSSVIRALKIAGVTVEKIPGSKGLRILERDANDFLARQWPEAGPLRPRFPRRRNLPEIPDQVIIHNPS